ncbi:MAG: 3'-5' exoribonuclease [Bacteriovoracaceae bacterium]|jgi:DNA polymerase-3 subunit epsilon|nr:3'-5' exoribonuclease [Bacteriovoracaceae bacterium]|tara:strand:- start:735 stop:1319 length:585 start_codon:yes stop_codon:yes gene_type:complete
MRYLSFDIEATGLEEDAYMIEFGMIPFDTQTQQLNYKLKRHFYIQCPSYNDLEAGLNQWVKDHNKELIQKAHSEGISLKIFKQELENYLNSEEVKEYFEHKKIVLFGKSLSAIDLPFLNRDLGWEWMNKYFHHRNLDLSCFCLGLIDLNKLKPGLDSGAKLMEFLQMGEVCHTALEDAENTAKMYLKLLEKLEN